MVYVGVESGVESGVENGICWCFDKASKYNPRSC